VAFAVRRTLRHCSLVEDADSLLHVFGMGADGVCSDKDLDPLLESMATWAAKEVVLSVKAEAD